MASRNNRSVNSWPEHHFSKIWKEWIVWKMEKRLSRYHLKESNRDLLFACSRMKRFTFRMKEDQEEEQGPRKRGMLGFRSQVLIIFMFPKCDVRMKIRIYMLWAINTFASRLLFLFLFPSFLFCFVLANENFLNFSVCHCWQKSHVIKFWTHDALCFKLVHFFVNSRGSFTFNIPTESVGFMYMYQVLYSFKQKLKLYLLSSYK